MNWMNGNLDKVQNKYKCSCGAESVHGVYDDENKHIGEFCNDCFGVYLEEQTRLTKRAADVCPVCVGNGTYYTLETVEPCPFCNTGKRG